MTCHQRMHPRFTQHTRISAQPKSMETTRIRLHAASPSTERDTTPIRTGRSVDGFGSRSSAYQIAVRALEVEHLYGDDLVEGLAERAVHDGADALPHLLVQLVILPPDGVLALVLRSTAARRPLPRLRHPCRRRPREGSSDPPASRNPSRFAPPLSRERSGWNWWRIGVVRSEVQEEERDV
jgi:hypothetical protein